MSVKLADIEGIGRVYANKLKKAGVTGPRGLLTKGATPEGRKMLSKKSGIGPKLVLEFVNHVDLFRIKGIAGEYAELLEEAGVDTVVELRKRKPEVLFKKMTEINNKKNLVRQMPPKKAVSAWVRQAKNLDSAIKYSSTKLSTKLVRQTPPKKAVSAWVRQAKKKGKDSTNTGPRRNKTYAIE
jgi:predicted flap endonuclease-1-like 5' DNA nuclease